MFRAQRYRILLNLPNLSPLQGLQSQFVWNSGIIILILHPNIKSDDIRNSKTD